MRTPGAPPTAGGNHHAAAASTNYNNHNSNNNAHLLNQLEDRMGQILDDADHKRCSEGNQRALLAEKLESLRLLTKELEKDEWMYAPKKAHHGLTLSNMRARTSGPFCRLVLKVTNEWKDEWNDG